MYTYSTPIGLCVNKNLNLESRVLNSCRVTTTVYPCIPIVLYIYIN